MAELTLKDAVNHGLRNVLKMDDTVVLMGQDIGRNGGVFRVTEGLFAEFGKDRVIDTPISEGAMLGAGVGMAISGLKPVIEMQFSGFMYQGFHQIVTQISRLRNRSRGAFTVPLVIRTPYGGGIRALELHSESMETLYAAIPGIKVVIPSTPYDAKGLLISAVNDPDPVLFMEPKRMYFSAKGEVPDKAYTVPIGKAKVVMEGDGLTLISWGAMMKETLEAAKSFDSEVIDIRTISPLDRKTILESIRKTKRCVIVHEAPRNVGVGAEIAAYIAEKCPGTIIRRVTAPDVIVPYMQLEKYYMPSTEKIIKACEEVMRG